MMLTVKQDNVNFKTIEDAEIDEDLGEATSLSSLI
jgi:hypothetical protein